MNCKEFEREIPLFLNNSFTDKELKNFLSHLEECEECREELSIQILVTEGVAKLEDGDAFDLQNAIETRVEEAKSKRRMHGFLGRVIWTMVGVSVAALLILLLFLFGFA